MDSDKYYNYLILKALLSTEGIGSKRVFALLSAFGNPDNIARVSASELQKLRGIDSNIAQRITTTFANLATIEKEIKLEVNKLKEINAGIITFLDPEYPNELKNIYDPPVILYYLGDINLASEPALAVVGTRMASNYGKVMAQKIAADLSANNLMIVSGLARGIDTIAHRAAIEAKGKTIAVTGSGLDVVYPGENKYLYASIARDGLILTEFPLGTKPDAPNFPKRNRIISGLSLGTLVIETRKNGGAMQTAAFALDQNREVFALPGNANSEMSDGTNMLIQKGEAKLVMNADDVIVEFQNILDTARKVKTTPDITLNLFEQQIYDQIELNPVHIDTISANSGISTSECLIHLLNLEFGGVIKQLPGKYFIRI